MPDELKAPEMVFTIPALVSPGPRWRWQEPRFLIMADDLDRAAATLCQLADCKLFNLLHTHRRDLALNLQWL